MRKARLLNAAQAKFCTRRTITRLSKLICCLIFFWNTSLRLIKKTARAGARTVSTKQCVCLLLDQALLKNSFIGAGTELVDPGRQCLIQVKLQLIGTCL
jgi:hypothetical protein